jgi:hypothetical protein
MVRKREKLKTGGLSMKKTEGYDEAPSGFQQKEEITPGGHHMIIKQVNETKSKGGKPMVVVLMDFAQNDTQAGLFMNEFKENDSADKKWPHRGTSYIMTQDWQDASKTSRNFKSFCTCFEKSNNCEMKWIEDPAAWSAQFKNKKIGGVFGVVHDVYNGKEFTKTELRWFTDDSKVETAQIPAEKQLTEAQRAELGQDSGAYQYQQQDISQMASSDGFIDVPEDMDEELPFA